MKTYYQCETCGRKFSTAEEATQCEEKHEELKAKEEKLKSEKKSRADKINELIKSYIDDYRTIPNISILWWL